MFVLKQELKNISKRTVYNVNKSVLEECICIGKERYFNNRKANIKEQKYNTKKSGVDLSVQGVIGEYSILDLFGLDKKVLSNTQPNSRSRDRGDMHYKGLKVDIKCPEHHYCPLQTREESKQYPSDIYALCTLERISSHVKKNFVSETDCTYSNEDRIEVVFQGCVLGMDLFKPENHIKKWNNGFYVYPQQKLISLEEAYQLHQSKTQPLTTQSLPTQPTETTKTTSSFFENNENYSSQCESGIFELPERIFSLKKSFQEMDSIKEGDDNMGESCHDLSLNNTKKQKTFF